jgi:lipopolysaccharide transport system ATP-binding protein
VPDAPPIISLRGVGLYYNPRLTIFSKMEKTFWALRGLDLTIFEGEKLGIIGRNGCGKTTLMRLLARIYQPDEGEIVYHRADCHLELLSIGVGFEGNLSGAENAVLNGMLMGKSRAHMLGRLTAIRDFSGLGDFFEWPVSTYSSGMITRLGFSTAMEVDPDVLLIDEVLGVGDAEFLAKSQAAVRAKFQSDRTVVLISHDPAIIQSICTRAIWLDRGKILAEGSAAEVSDFYRARQSP